MVSLGCLFSQACICHLDLPQGASQGPPPSGRCRHSLGVERGPPRVIGAREGSGVPAWRGPPWARGAEELPVPPLTPAPLLCAPRTHYPTAQPGQVPDGLHSFFPNSPALFSFATSPLNGSRPTSGYLPFSGVPGPLPCTQVESILRVT